MTKRLRITILGMFAAIGLGVAVAVALSTKPKSPSQPSANEPSAGVRVPGRKLTATARVLPEPDPAPVKNETTDAGALVPTAEGSSGRLQPSGADGTRFVSLADNPAAQGAYRLFTQQIQNLQESFDQFRDHQDRRQKNVSEAIADLQDQVDAKPEEMPPGESADGPSPARSKPAAETLPDDAIKINDDGSLEFSLEDSNVLDALKLLSRQANLDILVSKNVSGTVTASFRGVDVDAALAAILKSAGLLARREDGIVFIGTAADFTAMDQSQDRVLTRVYRPNYIKAADLMTLITPMLSTTVGRATVSAASQVDIPSDQTKTGGNDFAGPDVVVVRDYEAVLREVDDLFAQVDVNPKQVAIEAMIINVKLDDEFRMGVNWETLRDRNNVRLVVNNPLTSLAGLSTEGGLKFGFLDASLAVFIDSLEKIGDTNVIASPRVLCLNKQRAEIQIGEQLGYVNTTVTQTFSTQSVSFLDVGTLLRIRPFIGTDGKVRMEVHPELSTGSVNVSAGLTLPNKSVTQVTTNVMCDDGRTVVIGGLIREDLKTNTSQVPYFGNLPWVGPIFRTKSEDIERSEIIVLITPRIVAEPVVGEEGLKYQRQFTQRHSVVFDKMSPIARRNHALRYQRLARAAYAAGDYDTALRQIDWSIQFDSMNRTAIELRNDIVAAGGFEESIPEYLNQARSPLRRTHLDYSKEGYPWRPEQLLPDEPFVEPLEDPGVPGPTSTIQGSAPEEFGSKPKGERQSIRHTKIKVAD